MGDATWAPNNMRKYFQKLERANPDYVARGAPGHGFDGWLQVSNNNVTTAPQDPGIVCNLNAAMAVSGDDGSYPEANRMGGGRDGAQGLTLIPSR
jgi:choline dehydrogenase